ncbi:MAG: methylated-DNA--[protein]-cysteine S-methyltransferase [Acidobacteriota bacterium]
MSTTALPPRTELLRAIDRRDPSYEGIFITAVKTTGIFCRPTCTAKKPRPENVEFYPTCRDALFAGYRPCKRCRPLEPAGSPPAWLRDVLREIEADPARRWRDRDLRDLGLEPDRVRRWFQKHHGMTFHAYTRSRRLGQALGTIQGGAKVIDAAFDHGFDSLSGFNEAFRRLTGRAPTQAADAPRVLVTRLLTPLGPMIAGATDEALTLLEFADRRMLPLQLRRMTDRLGCSVTPGATPIHARLEAELGAYFAGQLSGQAVDFTVPIDAPGTPWQEQVWSRLREIPSGTTTTYGDLAADLGRPTAARAVARAVGDNRIAILVPCHRVVGADGNLTGYGGGLWRKRRLLEIEGG